MVVPERKVEILALKTLMNDPWAVGKKVMRLWHSLVYAD